MQYRVSPKSLENYSTEEWQARVDLAAAHRLAFNQGFSEGIFNHLTLTVPGPQRPLLPDSVRHALVRGDGVVLHGSRHRRR
jgi:ribulose-5-phosphate 4-epimerase/fuculose-1-phosphate aldolase